MKPRLALLAFAAALSTGLAAEPWNKVDELPGGIAVEIDEGTQFEGLDGVRLIERATFRRQLPNGTMETAIMIDCGKEESRIRGVRIVDGDKVLAQNVDDAKPYAPIRPGSAEAIYFRALCGKDLAGTPDGDAPAAAGGEAGE